MARIVASADLNTTRFEQGAKRMQAVGKKAAAGLAAAFASLAIVDRVRAMVGRLSDELDKVGKLSTRLQISAETVQRLGLAAEKSGTDVETLVNALTRMNRKLNDVSDQAATPALERLGIDAERFIALGVEDQLAELADAYAESANKGAALANLFKLLEDDAKKLIPLFAAGGEAARAMFETEVVSDENVRKIEALNDQLAEMKAHLDAIAGQKYGDVAGELNAFVTVFRALKNGQSPYEFLQNTAAAHSLGLGGLTRARTQEEIDAQKGDRLSAIRKEFEEFTDTISRAIPQQKKPERVEAELFGGAMGLIPMMAKAGAQVARAVVEEIQMKHRDALDSRADFLSEMLSQSRLTASDLGQNRSIGGMERNPYIQQQLDTERAALAELKSIRTAIERQDRNGGMAAF